MKDKEKYEKYIQDNNISNIILMDFLKKKELFEVLQACDYFITLSAEDIFGHTTLEAMANGLPVISSDRVVSSRDIIKDGENGYLASTDDEWFEKLSALIESEELRSKIGKNARMTVVERFSVTKWENKVVETFDSLCATK